MIPPRPTPSSRSAGTSRLSIIGFLSVGVPMLVVVLIAVLAPFSAVSLFGIRGSILALFACAPLTSLCLMACNLLATPNERCAGEAE